MPELNLGTLQGDVLPIYLAVRTIAGDLVPQPANSPTIDIVYVEPDTHVRKIAVPTSLMIEIEPGRYFFNWRIPRNEPPVLHTAMLHAVLDDSETVATDESFIVTGLIQNPEFAINIQILENTGICYPEVMPQSPKCRGRRKLPASHFKEVDIGLDDYAIEGVFRFGDQVVDRRVAGRFSLTIGVGRDASGFISSDEPGGGPAQRSGNPSPSMRYSRRSKYRYM